MVAASWVVLDPTVQFRLVHSLSCTLLTSWSQVITFPAYTHTHTHTHTHGLYPGLYCCPYWCLSPSQDPPQTAHVVEPCQLPEWEGIGLGLVPEGGTGAGRADWLRASLVQPRNNEPQPRVVFYGFSSHLATK